MHMQENDACKCHRMLNEFVEQFSVSVVKPRLPTLEAKESASAGQSPRPCALTVTC